MDILVNRFTVKYNGKYYGPGEIVRGVQDEQGRKLVDESNGEMQELPAAETAAEPEKDPVEDPEKEPVAEPEKEPAEDPEKEPVAEPEKEPAEDPEKEPTAEQLTGGLDPVDPTKTVKGKK